MPKFHSYSSQSGGYIRTNINGKPQVLQVSPSADDLLSELGFEYGEYIPRDVTKPLIILGVLETKPEGRSKQQLLDGIPKLAVEYCELDTDQQNILQAFLRERVADLTNADYEVLSQFLENESPLEQIAHRSPSSGTDAESPQPEELQTATDTAINLNAIPAELRRHDQWICWRTEMRNGKPTKTPISPHEKAFAKVNDPSTWASFEIAVDALSRDDVHGLGFVFTGSDTIAGIDLDDVRDPETGSLTNIAEEIVSTLDSYTEVSPSGTGLHVLIQGFVPEGRQRHDGIELYDEGRFFTVTGEHIESTPTKVAVRHNELKNIHQEHVAREDDKTTGSGSGHTSDKKPIEIPTPETDISPERIIKFGKRNNTFRQLWSGNTAGYDSHSEADMALCVLLAYYTGDNKTLMDAVFRQSGLMRSKWDEERGDQTYGELTLEKAIRVVDSYVPHLHGIEAAAPEADIATLEPEQKATLKVTVDQAESVPTEAIEQAGKLSDNTGSIRFVVWGSEYWDPEVQFSQGATYRLADAWITEYEGQREIHINEHTAIEKTSTEQ